MTRKYFLVGLGCILSGKKFLGNFILNLPMDEYELAGRKKRYYLRKPKYTLTMPICLSIEAKVENGKS